MRSVSCATSVSYTHLDVYKRQEYHLKDAIGRTWQLGTMQVDFMMPGRLGAEYVDEHSQRKHPVMLHLSLIHI